ALDPAMAAGTNAVEVIAARVGTVAVEVDADRTTAAAARTAAGLVLAELVQAVLLRGRGGWWRAGHLDGRSGRVGADRGDARVAAHQAAPPGRADRRGLYADGEAHGEPPG